MIDKSQIAIVTTVASFKIYSKTANLFPQGIDKIVIDGTTGFYGLNSINFMFKKLKNKQYKWIIMADEDVFFYNANLVFDLIEYMHCNNFDICGIRDGGMIQHRFHNPESINTFFSIINFAKIASFYDFSEVKQCQAIFPKLYSLENYLKFSYNYSVDSLKEPYYCFYFWAHLNHFKFLYLDTINPVGDDMVGNIILDPFGNKIGFHSWYARAYEVYEDQTIRINRFLKEFNIDNAVVDWKEIKVYRIPFYNWKKRFVKFVKKIKN